MATDSASSASAARQVAPRASHAAFEPPASRSDPVELLERQARTRVPELVPIRYGRNARHAVRVTHELDAQMRAEHGLTVSAYEVLMFLADAPEHRMRMSDIAQRVRSAAAAAPA